MDHDRFFDLVANGIYRIQGSHRILENHRAFLPAEHIHLFLAIVRDILALEQDLTLRNMTVLLKDTHDRISRNGFPGARLPDDPECLSFFQHKTDAIDSLYFAVIRGKGSMKVNHLQKRRFLFIIVHLLTSSVSDRMHREGRRPED